jgi:hypothetical protein
LLDFRQKRAALGIKTIALTPDTAVARNNRSSGLDEQLMFNRQMLPEDSYTAPVEIDVYGTKTAFLMFSDDIMGVVIESPVLADAMRQVFDLLRQQLDASPDEPV